MVTTMASGKPTTRATSDGGTTSRRCSTAATHSAAIGPNSGPTTIAPTMRIGLSSSTPTAARQHATREVDDVGRRQRDLLAGARLDRLPHDGVGLRARARPPRRGEHRRRARASGSSATIAPSRSRPRSRSDSITEARRLARDVALDDVAERLAARARVHVQVGDGLVAGEQADDVARAVLRDGQAQVQHAVSLPWRAARALGVHRSQSRRPSALGQPAPAAARRGRRARAGGVRTPPGRPASRSRTGS